MSKNVIDQALALRAKEERREQQAAAHERLRHRRVYALGVLADEQNKSVPAKLDATLRPEPGESAKEVTATELAAALQALEKSQEDLETDSFAVRRLVELLGEDFDPAVQAERHMQLMRDASARRAALEAELERAKQASIDGERQIQDELLRSELYVRWCTTRFAEERERLTAQLRGLGIEVELAAREA